MTITLATCPDFRPVPGQSPRRPAIEAIVTGLCKIRTWLKQPPGRLMLLIAATFLMRLLFAAFVGLGIDESYMVASGRDLHLSYFDHPPLAWWMAWGAAHIAGTDAEWAVRLPFVLTFALTTWLMYRLTETLFSARAGLWAAALLNLSPVFGVTTGAWVLPDGPLMAGVLGAAICLVKATSARGRLAWVWWIGVGLCSGLATLSKYSAVLTIAGGVIFLLTEPNARRWLGQPHPYCTGLLAAAMFLPVLVWNAQHGWVSLLFQGGRAGVGRLHMFGPLLNLGGEFLVCRALDLASFGYVRSWRDPPGCG